VAVTGSCPTPFIGWGQKNKLIPILPHKFVQTTVFGFDV